MSDRYWLGVKEWDGRKVVVDSSGSGSKDMAPHEIVDRLNQLERQLADAKQLAEALNETVQDDSRDMNEAFPIFVEARYGGPMPGICPPHDGLVEIAENLRDFCNELRATRESRR